MKLFQVQNKLLIFIFYFLFPNLCLVEKLIRTVGAQDPTQPDLNAKIDKDMKNRFIKIYGEAKVTQYGDIQLGCFAKNWGHFGVRSNGVCNTMHGWWLRPWDQLPQAVCNGGAIFHYLKKPEDMQVHKNIQKKIKKNNILKLSCCLNISKSRIQKLIFFVLSKYRGYMTYSCSILMDALLKSSLKTIIICVSCNRTIWV